MKKQLILLIVIILTQVCFSSLENNSLKACDATAKSSCSAKKNKAVTAHPDVYVEDLDASFNMFMNPFSKI
ncbi:MAG TPA: hypothetical protein VK484_01360 [Ferruginibacter sp.]|nr:hypothetical protein [Ferruginibacter sp.]